MISTLGLKAVYSDHLGAVLVILTSIGLVLKTIYNGNRISAELSQAKALADSAYNCGAIEGKTKCAVVAKNCSMVKLLR